MNDREINSICELVDMARRADSRGYYESSYDRIRKIVSELPSEVKDRLNEKERARAEQQAEFIKNAHIRWE